MSDLSCTIRDYWYYYTIYENYYYLSIFRVEEHNFLKITSFELDIIRLKLKAFCFNLINFC